jgi:transposase
MLIGAGGGMDRQTLRDWVHRYNTDGLAGLVDRARPGRQTLLSDAQLNEVAQWVRNGLLPALISKPSERTPVLGNSMR